MRMTTLSLKTSLASGSKEENTLTVQTPDFHSTRQFTWEGREREGRIVCVKKLCLLRGLVSSPKSYKFEDIVLIYLNIVRPLRKSNVWYSIGRNVLNLELLRRGLPRGGNITVLVSKPLGSSVDLFSDSATNGK